MKFKNKQTGVILEPRSETVLEQLHKSEDFDAYDGQSAGESGEKSLVKMNKDDLLKVAQEAGIAVPDGATKAQIVELIQAVRE